LRSARARRVERVVVVVSLFIDELLMLPLPVEPVALLSVVPLGIEGEPVVPVPIEDVPVVGDPLVVPVVERVVLPLLVVPLVAPVVPVVPVAPVVPVVPAFGPELVVLLLGAPEAPPWPPVPVCASAPPHAIAAAAERARILKVCLMGYS